jgi:Putative amidoligase enzyme
METITYSPKSIPQLPLTYDCAECCETSDAPNCATCDTCASCCECYTCTYCHSTYDPDNRTQCGVCDYCNDCCTCHYCEGCSENISEDDYICSLCERCESCCDRRGECFTCASCERRRSNQRYNQCSNCDSCENCCECSHCGSCGDVSRESTCGECERCNDCCTCGGDDNSEVLTDGTLTFHTATKLQHTRNTSKRYISLELEIASDDGTGSEYVTPVARAWRDAIVEDGSLPDSGYEINSNPSSGDVFLDHIGELCDALKDCDAKVTSACGMHCHIAAPDYSYFDLFKLCRLYASIENGLFELVAPSRRHNHRYTLKCASAYTFTHYSTFKADIIRALYGSDATEKIRDYASKLKPRTSYHRGKQRLSGKTQKYGDARYNALNLHSFFYRGTIEFRHHQGTTNSVKATNWGMVCAAIVDAGTRLTVSQIDALPSDPFARLLAILPSHLTAWAIERRATLSR